MFECTQIALKETIRELKKYNAIRIILTQIIYLTHTIYEIVKNIKYNFKLWYVILYSILTACTLFYLVFFIIVTDFKEGVIKNKFYKISEKIMNNLKRVVRIYSIIMCISAVTSLYTATTPFSIILTALMIVAFILQIFFEILIKIVCIKANYILEGIKADVNIILTPVNKVLKVVGKDFEMSEPTTTQRKLMLKAQKVKQSKAKEKRERKSELKALKKAERKLKTKSFFEKINIFKKKKKQPEEKTKTEDIYFLENKDTDTE